MQILLKQKRLLFVEKVNRNLFEMPESSLPQNLWFSTSKFTTSHYSFVLNEYIRFFNQPKDLTNSSGKQFYWPSRMLLNFSRFIYSSNSSNFKVIWGISFFLRQIIYIHKSLNKATKYYRHSQNSYYF